MNDTPRYYRTLKRSETLRSLYRRSGVDVSGGIWVYHVEKVDKEWKRGLIRLRHVADGRKGGKGKDVWAW